MLQVHVCLSWNKPWKHCDKIYPQNNFEIIFCHDVSKVYFRIDWNGVDYKDY